MRYRSITGNCSYLTSRGIAMKRLLMSLQIKMSWKVFSTGITGIIYVYAVHAVRCRIQVVVLLIYLCMHIKFCAIYYSFYSFSLLLICSFTHLLTHFIHLLISWFTLLLLFLYSFTLLLILLICSFYSFTRFTHLPICSFTHFTHFLTSSFTLLLILPIYSYSLCNSRCLSKQVLRE